MAEPTDLPAWLQRLLDWIEKMQPVLDVISKNEKAFGIIGGALFALAAGGFGVYKYFKSRADQKENAKLLQEIRLLRDEIKGIPFQPLSSGPIRGADIVITETDLKNPQLLAALAIVAAQAYSTDLPREDPLREATEEVMREEIALGRYPDRYYPVGIAHARLPDLATEFKREKRPTIAALGRVPIVHEWTVKPGKRLFLRLGERLKKVICEGGGINTDRTDDDMLETIAMRILKAEFANSVFWFPVAVLFSELVVQRSLDEYCSG